jgi:putative transposase
MIARGTAELYSKLGLQQSLCRPYTSDDNPYSESQFKTLKYRPTFPDRFGSIEGALVFLRIFFHWYNHEHYHSGICWLTPETVHYHRAETALAKRHQTVMKAYEDHPERFLQGPPKLVKLPESVWINKPFQNQKEAATQ